MSYILDRIREYDRQRELRRKTHNAHGRWMMAHVLEHGAQRLSLTAAEWDIAGDCEHPYTFSKLYRAVASGWVQNGGEPDYEIIYHNRCHVCPPCRKAAARMWRFRAMSEITLSNRTWFGTLTLRPEEQFKARCRAEQKLRRNGLSFAQVSEEETFRLVHSEVCRDLTLYLKRLRKLSGARLRYILVCEAHKSGLPHYHILVHECGGAVRQHMLRDQWTLGYSKWKLCENNKAAWYVTKYLTKGAHARVRASIRYGLGLACQPVVEDTALTAKRNEVKRENLTSPLVVVVHHRHMDISDEWVHRYGELEVGTDLNGVEPVPW